MSNNPIEKYVWDRRTKEMRPAKKPGNKPNMPSPRRRPNKRTVEAIELLESLNCDPLEGMARIAMDLNNSPELRGRMYAELAQYVHPKKKAVEVSGKVDLGLIDVLTIAGEYEVVEEE